MKLGIVLSDLHLGTGHKRGQINIYDDFREDERFEQLLDKYITGPHQSDDVTLIFNGDVFDLLKVPVNGKFPDEITERLALHKIEECLVGHPQFVRAIARFLAHGRTQIIFQPGNHDMEFFFPRVQERFCRAISGADHHPRVRFISEEPFHTLDGVQFHHGHQFEAIHAFDFKKLFLTRGHREPILNLPWGSLFVLHVVNKLVRERPYLDKVMPFWPLFAGGMIFDTRFTVKMVSECLLAFGQARLNPVWWQKRPFEKLSRFVSRDIAFIAGVESFAKKILTHSSEINTLFMGHTHCEMVRTWPVGKMYINTGTWLPMVSLRLANLGQSLNLHYGLIEWNDDGPARTSLIRWHGRKPESEEVIS